MSDYKKQKYDKLVRDGIPDHLKKLGGTPTFHVADTAEYRAKLVEKLFEEAEEFRQDLSLEEFADLAEVMAALAAELGFSESAIEEARAKKNDARGAFTQRIILDES